MTETTDASARNGIQPYADTSYEFGQPAAVTSVHQHLRHEILVGNLPQGAILSQGKLADQYGVSRTPLREALRMLQEEGLVFAEPNRRARVASFRLDDLEAVSAQRILLSALATYETVPHLEESDLARMEEMLSVMQVASEDDAREDWMAADAIFHDIHSSKSPVLLLQDLHRLQDRSSLYRSIWLRDKPHIDLQSETEHRILLKSCQQRNSLEAMYAIARHRARIAITVMTHAIPEREPTTIRTALRIVLGRSTNSEA